MFWEKGSTSELSAKVLSEEYKVVAIGLLLGYSKGWWLIGISSVYLFLGIKGIGGEMYLYISSWKFAKFCSIAQFLLKLNIQLRIDSDLELNLYNYCF